MTGIVTAGAVVAVLLLLTVLLYNRLVRARVRVDESWAQVATDLQRRHDLIPNLVATVGAYASHESAALTAVTEARTRALTAGDATHREAAEDELGAAIGRLLVRVEAYPQLQADAGFRDLQTELVATEDRLAFARDFATHRVARYHELLDTFPSVLVARAFGFERRASFVVDTVEARRAVTVDLDR